MPSPFRDAQHIGATLDWDVWAGLADCLVLSSCEFRLPPTVDEAKGQAKMMLADPDGYLIEIKAYADQSLLQRPAI